MADLPKPLLEAVKDLEEQFTVSTETLKAVSKHFASELTKGMFPGDTQHHAHRLTGEPGLTVEGGNIVRQAPSSPVLYDEAALN